MQDLSLSVERPAQHDEPVLDQRVHELRVLLPAVLLAQIARPVPGTPRASRTAKKHKLEDAEQLESDGPPARVSLTGTELREPGVLDREIDCRGAIRRKLVQGEPADFADLGRPAVQHRRFDVRLEVVGPVAAV